MNCKKHGKIDRIIHTEKYVLYLRYKSNFMAKEPLKHKLARAGRNGWKRLKHIGASIAVASLGYPPSAFVDKPNFENRPEVN